MVQVNIFAIYKVYFSPFAGMGITFSLERKMRINSDLYDEIKELNRNSIYKLKQSNYMGYAKESKFMLFFRIAFNLDDK